jgi:hypothetical protein
MGGAPGKHIFELRARQATRHWTSLLPAANDAFHPVATSGVQRLSVR